MPLDQAPIDPARPAAADELVRAVADLRLVCAGTLHVRTKVCGQPNCRCARDKAARHGPYYEWTYPLRGKLIHHVLAPEQARQLKNAIHDWRNLQRILARWRRQSAAIILTENRRKH